MMNGAVTLVSDCCKFHRTTVLTSCIVDWVLCRSLIRMRGVVKKSSVALSRPLFPTSDIFDYPPNLSILLGGGKETNRNSPSSGERRGKSPRLNPAVQAVWKCSLWFSAHGVLEVFEVHVIVATTPEKV